MKAYPIYISALGLALGCALGTLHTLSLQEVLFCFLMSFLALLFYLYRKSTPLLLAFLCILFFSFGVWRAYSIHPSFTGDVNGLYTSDDTIVGRVVTDPDIRETSQKVTIEVTTETTNVKVLADVPLYPEIQFGDTVVVTGTLMLPEAFETDTGRSFPYDKYLLKDGVYVVMKNVHETPVVTPPEDSLTHAVQFLFGIKQYMLESLAYSLVEPYASLAGGLILGAKQGLGDALMDIFNRVGLSHIVVLSGYNIMIVAAFVLAVCSWIPKRHQFVVVGGVIVLFVIMAGAGSASIRAGLMALIAMWGRTHHKTYDAVRALIIVACAMIVWSPYTLLYDPGFQLSVVATLGLLLLTPIIKPHVRRLPFEWLRELIASSIAAYISVLPLILYYTGFFSFVAVVANIIVLPIVPLAMLLSFITSILAIIFAPIGVLFGFIATLPLAYIVSVAELFASLPFVGSLIPPLPLWSIFLMYGMLAYSYYHFRTKKQVN